MGRICSHKCPGIISSVCGEDGGFSLCGTMMSITTGVGVDNAAFLKFFPFFFVSFIK